MTYPPITSLQNPLVKQAVRLRKRRERDQSNTFLIEGYRELCRAIEQNLPLNTLFFCPDLFLGVHEPQLIERAQQLGAQSIPCSKSVFAKLSYRDRPDGLLAIAPQKKQSLHDLSLPPNPLLVVAEAIEKPGNLGTILRSCDGAHVDGMILCDPTTDLFNPNVVRASIGTLFTVPIAEATTETTLSWLKKNTIQTVAATPQAKTLYTDADLTTPTALIVGTEQHGLSPPWLEQTDHQVRIPILGSADSLNVAVAAALVIFEARRQRGKR